MYMCMEIIEDWIATVQNPTIQDFQILFKLLLDYWISGLWISGFWMSGFLDFEFLDFGSLDSWILGFGISGFFDICTVYLIQYEST